MTEIDPTTTASTNPSQYLPEPHRGVTRSMSQVIEIQNKVHSEIIDPLTDKKTLAALARAWCDLEERRRVLRGVPLPGSYRPEKKSKNRDLNPFNALKIKQAKVLDIKATTQVQEQTVSDVSIQSNPTLDKVQ